MSKNQLAHQDLYDSIRAIDINALRAFILCTTADIVAQISYWENRKKNPTVDADQMSVINLEIIRLESIMIARTRITMDLFEVVELTEKDSEVLSKDLHKTIKIEGGTETEAVNLPAGEVKPIVDEKPEAKVIHMDTTSALKPLKLHEIQAQVKELLEAGKAEEAFKLAFKFLAVAAYVPNKGNQKSEIWHEGRIKGWIAEIAKHVKVKPATSKNAPAVAATTNQTTNAPTETTSGTATSTKEDVGTAQSQKSGIKATDAIVVGPIEILVEEWDSMVKWIEESGKKLSDFFTDDDVLLTEAGRKEFSCFDIDVENPEETIKMLKTKYGINAAIPPESDPSEWENQTNSLQEEIDLIEAFLEKAFNLRGEIVGDPKNVEEIKTLCDDFFEMRTKEDYPEMDKISAVIIGRPSLLVGSKEFFSLARPALSLYTIESTGQPSKDNAPSAIDCYDVVREEIKKDLVDMKLDEETRKALYVKWITKLNGKILAGKKPGDKNPNPTNRVSFYTGYHVIHFIEQVEAEILFGNEAINKGENHIEPKGEATASTSSDPNKSLDFQPDASTTPVVGASEQQTEQVNSESVKPKIHEPKTLEEALFLVIKNGGELLDALVHPFCEKLKGTKVKDPNAIGEIELNDENYEKYITSEFDKVAEVWKSQQTTYPVDEMAKLISLANSTGVTPEEFVKENIGLIQKSNGEFLNITGEIGDVEQSVIIKSEKDFLVYVAEMYALEEKLNEKEADGDVQGSLKFEVSKYKNFLEFENAIKEKVTKDKVTFEELQKWAREEVVGKLFTTDPSDEPVFTHEKVANLDTWLEIVTRKLYETPEIFAAKMKKVEDEAIKRMPTSTTGLLGFMSEVKAFCVAEKIDYSLKDLRVTLLKLAEVHNKDMYNNYMKNMGEAKDAGLISDKAPEAVVDIKKDAEKTVIVDAPVDKDAINKATGTILGECKDVKTKAALAEVLGKHKENPAAMLRAALFLVGRKQITDMQISEAEVNTWVTSLVSPKTESATAPIVAPATDVAPAATDTVKPTVNPVAEYETLKLASDKKNFREALDAIARKFEDSTERRSEIIAIVQAGSGAHTRKVGRGPVQDINIAIKNAYERVASADKTPDVE
jgi:hypothetical protein